MALEMEIYPMKLSFFSKDSGGDVAHVACDGDIDAGFALRRIAYFLNG